MQPPGAALLFHRREASEFHGDACDLAMVDHGRSTAGDREQVPKARHAASTTRRRNMGKRQFEVCASGAPHGWLRPGIWENFG